MRILDNEPGCSAEVVKSRYQALLEQMHQHAGDSPWLGQVVNHFTKVTRSYWPDLFHCYEIADLPRTNNDLEQLFGSTRYHERRATGRKLAGVNLVVVGPARLPAALATRIKPFSAVDLVPRDLAKWQAMRAELARCHESRVWGVRFRRNPGKYLAQLEEKALKLSLRP